MIHSPAAGPDVFAFYLAPAAGLGSAELEAGLRAQLSTFALVSRPYLDPALWSHRILRAEDGGLSWELSFHGLDLPGEEQASDEPLVDSVRDEVRARVEGLAVITGFAAFIDVSTPPPSPGFNRIFGEDGPRAFLEDESDWLAYAADSGKGEAGTPVAGDILEVIVSYRGEVPVEAGLRAYKAGHMYTGAADDEHTGYLKGYLDARAAKASFGDQRKIRAFAAFQAREGSTAAINTYDNQIVTWGTGWGGLGWLGSVMERTTANDEVRDRFGSAGLGYRKNSVYDVVDVESGEVVTGKAPALEVIRHSLPLLYLLIDVARDPATRDAVTEAQLQTFMVGSGNISGADAIKTQALFNLVAHLKHWAPGYVTGCLEWAVPQLEDPTPSVDRDRRLAVLVGRYFYGKARKTKWIPTWSQFQLYFKHMKSDGLDCTDDPFIKASAPPSDDPFVAHPLTPAKPTTTTPTTPAPAKPPAAKAPSHAPLAGQAELERVAAGQSTLRRGAKGDGVKALQLAFLKIGTTVPGGADGDFGPSVEKVVKAFQAQSGLSADGIVGRATLLALDAKLASLG